MQTASAVHRTRRLCYPARAHLKGGRCSGVRDGDDEWSDIVRWVVYALFEAEEKGITARTSTTC